MKIMKGDDEDDDDDDDYNVDSGGCLSITRQKLSSNQNCFMVIRIHQKIFFL